MYLKKDEIQTLAQLLEGVDSPLADKIRESASLTKVINCTPHDVVIVADDGSIIKAYPAAAYENVCRIKNYRTVSFMVGDVPVFVQNTDCEVINPLPPEKRGTYYIVSRIVSDALPDRNDLLVPDQTVRVNGDLVGCRGLLWA